MPARPTRKACGVSSTLNTPVDFPARDNFVHGSAGPVEGLVERAVHEADVVMDGNPIGRYLAERGVTLDRFMDWKSKQSVSVLGKLFDTTEEKNTDEVFQTLEQIRARVC